MIKEEISLMIAWKFDVCAGTVLMEKRNMKARSPSYDLMIDFGEEIGEKRSSAQIVENYAESDLTGKQTVQL